MLKNLMGCFVVALFLALWPFSAQAQDTATAQSTASVTQTVTTTVPLRVDYTFPPLIRSAPELYPDPDLSEPAQPDSDNFYMQAWRPHPRYVNGSCAWLAQDNEEGMLISIDAICLSPPHTGQFRSIELTAADRTGRPLGGTLMTYLNGASVGVYPITESPFSLTVDASEVFDRVGVYFRRPTVFDDVVISSEAVISD